MARTRIVQRTSNMAVGQAYFYDNETESMSIRNVYFPYEYAENRKATLEFLQSSEQIRKTEEFVKFILNDKVKMIFAMPEGKFFAQAARMS